MIPAKPVYGVGKIVPKVVLLVFPIALFVVLSEPRAHAVPSYSRQTGLACSACHYTPPELTPFGRKFKLEGYTFATKPEINDDKEKKTRDAGLNILEAFPLSVLFFTSYTLTKSPQPGAENGNFEFPQQASLFVAGRWTEHVGSFAQVTYSQTGNHFSWDNTDVRYANNSRQLFGKPVTYGVTFNNNPTVEDLWNSTPAWGFPFSTFNVGPSPSAAAVINSRLSQDVAGLGGYAMWNDHLYVVGTVYRSAHLGGAEPNTGNSPTSFPFNIRGTVPYWRVAWQTATENNNLEIGTYGLHMKSSPGGVVGPKDGFTDYAFDFQYDRTIPQFRNDVLSFRGTFIRENSTQLATAPLQPRNHLNTVQGNLEYHFGNRVSATGSFFNTTGTLNQFLFTQAPVSGSLTGRPSTTGYIAEVDWWPQQNFKLGAQYTGYTRFNGAGTNYDGAGRKASANNAIYLIAEFTF